MSRLSKTLAVLCLLLITVAPAFSAPQFRARVVGPAVVVRPYGFYGSAGFGPRFWGPRWGYYGYGPTAYAYPATGDVKIKTHMKDAVLYVDGGYVGPVDKFKNFGLKPGTHDIELRAADCRRSTSVRARSNQRR